ncbi:MAG: SsrA-binding protein SmpB [Planctomycetes bacterium]|nr:SsrA-binding protein SmpB [Planctomycetota bacterium]
MDAIKIVVKNKKAFANYEILEKYEGGLSLRGTEVKSIRDGNASITEGYLRVSNGEVFIYNMEIALYAQASNFANHEPKRPRKVLLHKSEIHRLLGKTAEEGKTLVPLALYFKKGLAKIEFAVARGKKLYDKRADMKKKESDKHIRMAMRGKNI